MALPAIAGSMIIGVKHFFRYGGIGNVGSMYLTLFDFYN